MSSFDARISDHDALCWANYEHFIKTHLPHTCAAELLDHAKPHFQRRVAERERFEQGLSSYFRRLVHRR